MAKKKDIIEILAQHMYEKNNAAFTRPTHGWNKQVDSVQNVYRAAAQEFLVVVKENLLTHLEKDMIEEGLNYLEENGAPGMSMRGGTQRMETLIESIARKLEL